MTATILSFSEGRQLRALRELTIAVGMQRARAIIEALPRLNNLERCTRIATDLGVSIKHARAWLIENGLYALDYCEHAGCGRAIHHRMRLAFDRSVEPARVYCSVACMRAERRADHG